MGTAEYHDEEVLRELYTDQRLSTHEIGDRFDVSGETIRRWLSKHGIERRDRYEASGDAVRVDYAKYTMATNGYMEWSCRDPEHGAVHVSVARFLMAAEHGLDATKGKHVHHRNGIQWDNRPQNMVLVDPGDHAEIHADETAETISKLDRDEQGRLLPR